MTTKLSLSTTPVRVSNGSKEVHVTVNKGSKPRYAISVAQPNTNQYHVLLDPVMNIGEGYTVWMWKGDSDPLEIVYSEKI